ncbi:hypothetical protein CNMCM6805_003811 [Aspergillus fumigatiaffinis]|uniref:Uncharacterized protein n=1 Tax=Aspergillus fumigatiaffinis TaxID=340414 RepID=A0A8H4HC06_9EURO|nr:hypothetical protein CNMCM6805_003811 [Aspergillus fumigatiaffinis]
MPLLCPAGWTLSVMRANIDPVILIILIAITIWRPAPAAVTMVAVVVLPAHFDVHFILVLLLATQIFHQWRIHPSAYKRVAVVSHRGQEYFKGEGDENIPLPNPVLLDCGCVWDERDQISNMNRCRTASGRALAVVMPPPAHAALPPAHYCYRCLQAPAYRATGVLPAYSDYSPAAVLAQLRAEDDRSRSSRHRSSNSGLAPADQDVTGDTAMTIMIQVVPVTMIIIIASHTAGQTQTTMARHHATIFFKNLSSEKDASASNTVDSSLLQLSHICILRRYLNLQELMVYLSVLHNRKIWPVHLFPEMPGNNDFPDVRLDVPQFLIAKMPVRSSQNKPIASRVIQELLPQITISMHLEMPYMRPREWSKHTPYGQFQTVKAPLSKLNYMTSYWQV